MQRSGLALATTCLLACGRLNLYPTGEIDGPDSGIPSEVPDAGPPLVDAGVDAGQDAGPCATAPTIVASSSILPPAVVGAGYQLDFALVSVGGKPSFFLVGGTLPPGLSLDEAGELQGTPSALPVPDPALFEIDATDGRGCESPPVWFELNVEAFEITPCDDQPLGCDAGATGPLQFLTSVVIDAQLDVSYDVPLVASGGNPPYLFSLENGSLPPGLFLSPSGGIEGTPSGPLGPSECIIEVSDASGAISYSQPLQITVVQ